MTIEKLDALLQDLAGLVNSLSWPIQLGFVLWLLIMILVPVFKWRGGEKAEQRGIELGVLAQVLLVSVMTFLSVDMGKALTMVILVPVLGWVAEYLGSHTGIPFGRYGYTQRLQPQLGGVPVLVPLAWLMMMAPSWAIAQSIMNIPALGWMGPGSLEHTMVFAGLSAAAMTAWDFYLDPQMVGWQFWVWEKKRGYFGIPWVNFAGWFLVSFLITLIIGPALPDAARPVFLGVYILTWILELLAQVFFWNLKGPAIGGFVAMGAMIAPLILDYFARV